MATIKFVEKLDPRTKIVLVVVISTLSIIITDVLWLAGLLLLSLLLLFMAGFSPASIFSRFRRFLYLFLVLLIVQSIFAPSGEPIITIGGIQLVTMGGLLKGVAVVVRMLIIISSALLLLTAKPMELVLGLIRLKIPYEIAFMVLLAIRFLPVLVEEVQDALTAIQLRGVKIKEIPLGQKIKVYTYIFMPVVVSALMKAKKTAISMEARAFRAYPHRTYLEELKLKSFDYATIAAALLFGAGLGAAYFMGR
ncbi:MAG: energy-coupling factor transporter transmembrane component T [Dethiobacteria bacterium]